jgi:hypothetical protein
MFLKKEGDAFFQPLMVSLLIRLLYGCVLALSALKTANPAHHKAGRCVRLRFRYF